MRLYKHKDIPKSHRSALDSPPRPSSTSPGSPTPHRLKRAAEAVSKQISGHKAMVAQFKEMRLPRPQMFSTKPATTTQTDHSHPHSLPPKQSKAAKGFGEPQTAPESFPIPTTPTSAISLKQRAVLSDVNANSASPTRPPGLGLEKATSPVNKPSGAHAPPKTHQYVSSPTRSSRQRAGAKPATLPSDPTSNVASLSIASAPARADPDEPILFVSCFHSREEDPEIEEDLLDMVELTSDFESQVAQIFGVGLGYVSEDEVVKHGEIAPPKATPETTPASALEPMSAVVEWWEPEPSVSPAIEFDVAMAVKSQGRTDGSEAVSLYENKIARVPSTYMGKPSLSLARPPTSVARFDMGLPKLVPCQLPSSADYEYVASLGQGAFGSVALYIHKQSRRQCAIKIIRVSDAILEEQRVVRAVLAEQRIMRDASGYPFLLGLLASFRDVHGFHLVSEYCRYTLFDGRFHMPESYKKLASAELACAVNHLHRLGIVHRDIKLENVMLKTDGHVVLGDFDLAVRLPVEAPGSRALQPALGKGNAFKTRGVCGTLPYMAPEVLRNMEYSYAVDWFAYGVFLHVFYLDKFPWLGEYEHPASYLKEMMSTISLGLIFRENGLFGDLLNELFCVDQDARADFSVIRRSTFFADFDWQGVTSADLTASRLSARPVSGEIPPPIRNIVQCSVDPNPYSEFTWLDPSMIVEEATPDTEWSHGSAIAKYYTPSHFDAPSSGRSPIPCGSLQFFNSFSLSRLFQDSSCDFDSEDHLNDVLRNSVRTLDEGEDPIFTFPAAWIAAFGDSVLCLGQGTTAPPAREDDEALARTSIKSLDIGEEPVFELPSGWKEAFVSLPDVITPSLSQSEATKKTSVLPKLKSLWKRATSKFGSRRV